MDTNFIMKLDFRQIMIEPKVNWKTVNLKTVNLKRVNWKRVNWKRVNWKKANKSIVLKGCYYLSKIFQVI